MAEDAFSIMEAPMSMVYPNQFLFYSKISANDTLFWLFCKPQIMIGHYLWAFSLHPFSLHVIGCDQYFTGRAIYVCPYHKDPLPVLSIKGPIWPISPLPAGIQVYFIIRSSNHCPASRPSDWLDLQLSSDIQKKEDCILSTLFAIFQWIQFYLWPTLIP